VRRADAAGGAPARDRAPRTRQRHAPAAHGDSAAPSAVWPQRM